MARIKHAVAIANNEVAYLGWQLDVWDLDGLLGFHIVREHLDATDKVIERRPLASYVAFRGQSNPKWQPQNTTVWPVQKFTWRDLTLRQRRDTTQRRAADQRVRYRIAAVGKLTDALTPVEIIEQPNSSYEGTPIPLGYLTEAVTTNIVTATANHPPFTSTFTNGILSTQFLLHALGAKPTPGGDAKIPAGLLEKRLRKPDDALRTYLSGDVLPLIRDFFESATGRYHLALYELDDKELLDLLKTHAAQIDLILSDAGSVTTDAAGVKSYDTRNGPARRALRRIASARGSTFTLQDRMFNGSGHIGHNKFAVHVDDAGHADAVLTGSTNWTWSGVAGQSNNCIRIDDPDIAQTFFEYWLRLQDDPLPVPKPIDAPSTKADQSDKLKLADTESTRVTLANGASAEIWFSPNVPKKTRPPQDPNAAPPPDMDVLFSLMRKAKRAIFFLVFLPSLGGLNSIVSEAVNLGLKDSSLDVIGAISDSTAMWGAEPARTVNGRKIPAWSPHVFTARGVSVVRATALTDKEIGKQIGDFELGERLAAEKAIIHDKILVLDPLDPQYCVVAFGSHNLGYKASYSNDENLTIVRGHRALAEAYTTHVLDVYDHYRFRAAQAESVAAPKPGTTDKQRAKPWDGFLSTDPAWQDHSSHRLANYLISRAADWDRY